MILNIHELAIPTIAIHNNIDTLVKNKVRS